MKWIIEKDKDDDKYPIALFLSFEGSTTIKMVSMDCGNFESFRSVLHFINEVKHAQIKTMSEIIIIDKTKGDQK